MANGFCSFGIRSLLALQASILSGCAPVLSERTDDQEWMRYRSESIEVAQSVAISRNVPFTDHKTKEALERIPLRTILLECSRGATPDSCFAERIGDGFDDVMRASESDRISQPEEKSWKSVFLESNSHQKVLEQVRTFYQGLLSGIEISARGSVGDLLQSCGFSENSVFTQAVEGCFRSKMRSDMEQLLSKTADRLGLVITTQAARDWIVDHQITPIYEAELERIRKRDALAGAPEF
ncbi:MAG: hypothetical protein KGP28_02875 [Bdellovibrionales bacterium]|nr:hypothetical protein [Bdellovibrionales bacterium]